MNLSLDSSSHHITHSSQTSSVTTSLSSQPTPSNHSSMPSTHIPNSDSLDDEEEENRVLEVRKSHCWFDRKTDPTGRFERYATCLGKGAYKEVFKAFDQEEGVEVAWNQLRLDTLNKRDICNILSEIRILESLRNENIINLYYSWTSKGKDNKERIIFITEHMTSGTLKNYIKKTKGAVKPKVLKNWSRQILSGLAYLHSRNPPIIHRDLKCENIFINGNNGQAKIGDLGLATVKSRDHMSSVLGTPEFMAPELYDESYDEKVDIYAFGMVVLEIVTKEYPYSECSNQAQIYKKVTTGIKPLALSKIADEETRLFIDWCITSDKNRRPSAAEVLQHPFLANVSSILLLETSTGSIDWIVDKSKPESMSQEFAVPQTKDFSTNVFSSDANKPIDVVKSLNIPVAPLGILSSSAPDQDTLSLFAGLAPSLKKSESQPDRAITYRTGSLPRSPKSQHEHAISYHTGSLPRSPPLPVKSILEATSNKQTSSPAQDSSFQLEDSQNFPFQILQSSSGRQSVPSVCSTDSELSQSVTSLNAKVNLCIQVTERDGDSQVLMKLSYPTSNGMQEIKFPFNLSDDTATDVVSEMVSENLIEAKDEAIARRKLEEVIRKLLMNDRAIVSSNAVTDGRKIDVTGGLDAAHNRSASAGPDAETLKRISDISLQPLIESIPRSQEPTSAQRLPLDGSMSFDPAIQQQYLQHRPKSPPTQYLRSGSSSPRGLALPAGSGTEVGPAELRSSRPNTPLGGEYAVNPLTGQLIPLNHEANRITDATFPKHNIPDSISTSSDAFLNSGGSSYYYQRGVSTSSSTSAESNTSGSTISQGHVHFDNEVGVMRRVVSIGASGPVPLPSPWSSSMSEASTINRDQAIDPALQYPAPHVYTYGPYAGYRAAQSDPQQHMRPHTLYSHQHPTSYTNTMGRVELPPLPPQHPHFRLVNPLDGFNQGPVHGHYVDSNLGTYYYQRPVHSAPMMQRTSSEGSSTSSHPDVNRLPTGPVSRVPLKPDTCAISPSSNLPSLNEMLGNSHSKTRDAKPSDTVETDNAFNIDEKS